MKEVKEMILPQGCAARPGYPMTPLYITIHNTGNANKGAGAEAHGRYMLSGGKNNVVGYHYVVDDGLIVRLLPDTENAWHAGDGGSGTGNRQSLAIEICENPESDLAKATDNAAELAARLMHDYKIPLKNVRRHCDWNKNSVCPHLLNKGKPYTWQAFLDKVQKCCAGKKEPPAENAAAGAATLYAVQTGAFKNRQNAEAYAAQLKQKGVETYITEKEV